ncbi:MAG: 2-hydroxychromene-2-carboxylate isomerase [Hansschlegelia sp.]
MPRHVDVYFSTVSPWAYLGHEPFMDLVGRRGLTVGWRPLSLGPLFSETGGLPLGKRSLQRRRYRDVELQRWAQKRGRPLNLRPKHWPFDGALADAAVLAIVALGEDPATFAGAAMRGVWEEERDLGSRETIAGLLSAAGHDAEAVLATAAGEGVATAYELNRVAGQDFGVFGSPTYVLDGEVFWGQDRLDLLDDALESGRPPFSHLD